MRFYEKLYYRSNNCLDFRIIAGCCESNGQSINYSDRTISAIGIGFVPINAVNAGMARRLALRTAKQDA